MQDYRSLSLKNKAMHPGKDTGTVKVVEEKKDVTIELIYTSMEEENFGGS